MSTPRHTFRTSLAVLTAAALTLTPSLAAVAAGQDTALNANELAAGAYTAITDTGTDFTLFATESKAVNVDPSDRISDRGDVFEQRIKLNGSGTADARSLHFTVTDAPTELFVNARSGNSSSDRALALYDSTGTVVGTAPALADSSTLAVETASITIDAPGDYWLASPSSGVNVYYAQLGAFDPVTRAAWSDVAIPVIDAVAGDPDDASTLEVHYTGLLGTDGGDVVYATLYDSEGDVADQTLDATDSASGTLSLTPPASGDYTVEVRLTRFGESEPRTSARATFADFALPLGEPEITGALTTGVSAGTATVTLTWSGVAEAEEYSVETSQGGTAYTTAVAGITDTTAEVTGLVPGQTYQMRVVAHRGDDATTGPATDVAVAGAVERWQIADIGSNAGSGGAVTENADGSITFDARASSTKLATSEDGFQYYYTEIDPETENFTLSATFRVDDSSAKDAQSGFGVIAVDTLVPGESPARYFNSAGALLTRYNWGTGSGEWFDGTPGARFVQGYTGAPTDNTAGARDMTDSSAFDLDWRADTSGVKFQDGDEYELSLRKSNTGFHAIWHRDGDVLETIQYDPDMLLQQDSERFYVGMATARKIQVTVTEWNFTTIHPADDDAAVDPPTEYVTPTLAVDAPTTTPEGSVEVALTSNVHGTGQILDAAGTVIADGIALAPGERGTATVAVSAGDNAFTARLLPAEEQPQLGEREELASLDPVDAAFAVTVDSFGTPGQSLWVAPDGSPSGAGTQASPLDIHTAVAFAQAGQQIVLEGGTYLPERAIVAERGHNGTEEAPITILSEPGTRAVLDLTNSPDGGLILRGDWWHVYNLEIKNSADKKKPMLVQGNHNIVERVESHHNRDTGIQISGSESEPRSLWPTHNLVVSSVSHNNADVGGNDADGFAAKLTVGEGNVFRHNIAYNNIDDGWDLYAKSTTGPIGTVIVEDSVAYDNGWLEDEPARTGEGNGFKLGGESMPGDHLLRNSISYGNLATGVTSNSGPDVRLENVTSVGNQRGVRLETNASTTNYQASGVISWQASALDTLSLKQSDTSLLTNTSNHWNLGGPSAVSDDWFVSTDLDGIRPTIGADGSIDMHGLLTLTDAAPADTGARLETVDEPTDIEVLPEVTVPLENLVAPSIAGDPVKGETLTANVGDWSHADATFTYQWLRDGEPISGKKGTEASYKVRGGDTGHSLSVEVTATVDGQEPVSVVSAAVEIDDDKPGRVEQAVHRAVEAIRSIVDWLRGIFG